jgi:hypothetical protein
MTGERDSERLARLMLGRPEVATEVIRLAAQSGAEDDGPVRARRLLDDVLRKELDCQVGDDALRNAAAIMSAELFPEAAHALEAIAATGPELAEAGRLWARRYLHRPDTEAQQAALALMTSGRVIREDGEGARGIDGGWYADATLIPADGSPVVPAVVISTPARALEVVTGFASLGDRARWMADRSPVREGPLASCASGPPCRAAREDLAVAWLLGQPSVGAADGLHPDTFTTPARAEIYLAWEAVADGLGSTEWRAISELSRRLRRAPEWGAEALGGPDGAGVHAYLVRLLDTPVTEQQARAAIAELIREDAAIVVPGRRYAVAPVPGITPQAGHAALAKAPVHPALLAATPPQPGPVPGAQSRLRPPEPGDPGPGPVQM